MAQITVTLPMKMDGGAVSSASSNAYLTATSVTASNNQFGPLSKAWFVPDFSTLPIGAVIVSATLRLYASSSSSTHTVILELTEEEAPSSGFTWANQPSTTGGSIGSQVGSTGVQAYAVDDAVRQMWSQGGQSGSYAFIVRSQSPLTSSIGTTTYRTTEFGTVAQRPTLTVVYDEPVLTTPGSSSISQSEFIVAPGSQQLDTKENIVAGYYTELEMTENIIAGGKSELTTKEKAMDAGVPQQLPMTENIRIKGSNSLPTKEFILDASNVGKTISQRLPISKTLWVDSTAFDTPASSGATQFQIGLEALSVIDGKTTWREKLAYILPQWASRWTGLTIESAILHIQPYVPAPASTWSPQREVRITVNNGSITDSITWTNHPTPKYYAGDPVTRFVFPSKQYGTSVMTSVNVSGQMRAIYEGLEGNSYYAEYGSIYKGLVLDVEHVSENAGSIDNLFHGSNAIFAENRMWLELIFNSPKVNGKNSGLQMTENVINSERLTTNEYVVEDDRFQLHMNERVAIQGVPKSIQMDERLVSGASAQLSMTEFIYCIAELHTYENIRPDGNYHELLMAESIITGEYARIDNTELIYPFGGDASIPTTERILHEYEGATLTTKEAVGVRMSVDPLPMKEDILDFGTGKSSKSTRERIVTKEVKFLSAREWVEAGHTRVDRSYRTTYTPMGTTGKMRVRKEIPVLYDSYFNEWDPDAKHVMSYHLEAMSNTIQGVDPYNLMYFTPDFSKVPRGTVIESAELVLTVSSGGAVGDRGLSYGVTPSKDRVWNGGKTIIIDVDINGGTGYPDNSSRYNDEGLDITTNNFVDWDVGRLGVLDKVIARKDEYDTKVQYHTVTNSFANIHADPNKWTYALCFYADRPGQHTYYYSRNFLTTDADYGVNKRPYFVVEWIQTGYGGVNSLYSVETIIPPRENVPGNARLSMSEFIPDKRPASSQLLSIEKIKETTAGKQLYMVENIKHRNTASLNTIEQIANVVGGKIKGFSELGVVERVIRNDQLDKYPGDARVNTYEYIKGTTTGTLNDVIAMKEYLVDVITPITGEIITMIEFVTTPPVVAPDVGRADGMKGAFDRQIEKYGIEDGVFIAVTTVSPKLKLGQIIGVKYFPSSPQADQAYEWGENNLFLEQYEIYLDAKWYPQIMQWDWAGNISVDLFFKHRNEWFRCRNIIRHSFGANDIALQMIIQRASIITNPLLVVE